MGGQRLRPLQRRLGRTDDQEAALGAIVDARDRRRFGQSGKGEQRGDLGGCGLGFGRPAAGFADVDEPDRLRLAALLRDVAEEARFLRAGDDDIARRTTGEGGELLLAQHRPHFRGAGKLERARQRRRVDGHRAVAGAEVEMLVGQTHRVDVSAPPGGSDAGASQDSPGTADAGAPTSATAGGSARGVWVSPSGSTAAKVASPVATPSSSGGHVLHVTLRVDAGGRRIEDIAALHHLANDVGLDRIGFGIVVDVHVETVHHVETRIAEQLLQRLPLQRFVDLGLQECRKIGVDRQRFDRGQRVDAGRSGRRFHSRGPSRHCRRRRCDRCADILRFCRRHVLLPRGLALQPRPAPERQTLEWLRTFCHG